MFRRTLIAFLALTVSALVSAWPHASKNPVFDHINAIVQTLSAGNYSAVVRGVNGETGVGSVEVYQLP